LGERRLGLVPLLVALLLLAGFGALVATALAALAALAAASAHLGVTDGSRRRDREGQESAERERDVTAHETSGQN
jgi:hypothetical protein